MLIKSSFCAQAMAPMSQQERSPLLARLLFQLLETHASDWTPDQAAVTLNARMDARLVPSPASTDGVFPVCWVSGQHTGEYTARHALTAGMQRRHAPELRAPGGAGRHVWGARAGGIAGASDRARLGPHAGAAVLLVTCADHQRCLLNHQTPLAEEGAPR